MKRKDLFILSADHVQNILIRAISNTRLNVSIKCVNNQEK